MKKRNRLFMILALVLCMGILFTACGGKTPNTPSESDSSQTGDPNTSDTPNTGDDDPDTPNTGGDDPDTQYTAIFDSQGGSAVESQTVASGSLLTVPANPSKDNYSFDGWYVGADANAMPWNFAADRVAGSYRCLCLRLLPQTVTVTL